MPVFIHEIDNNGNLFIKRHYNIKLSDLREQLIWENHKLDF